MRHIHSILPFWRRSLDFYGRKPVLRRAFLASTLRQRAYALTAIHFISNGERSVYDRGASRRRCGPFERYLQVISGNLIAIGNATFAANRTGTAPGPTVGLARAIVQLTKLVMWVDEFRTSMLCCNCQAVLHKPQVHSRRKYTPQGIPRLRHRPYHVRHCPNSQCSHRWWQRDVSAALAIGMLACNAYTSGDRGRYTRGRQL